MILHPFSLEPSRDILPKVLVAGESAGVLTAEGQNLDPTGTLQPGCSYVPPRG